MTQGWLGLLRGNEPLTPADRDNIANLIVSLSADVKRVREASSQHSLTLLDRAHLAEKRQAQAEEALSFVSVERDRARDAIARARALCEGDNEWFTGYPDDDLPVILAALDEGPQAEDDPKETCTYPECDCPGGKVCAP